MSEFEQKMNEPPRDIRQMTIRNLDTGEEFIIGENDPDFEFNTFELQGLDPPDAPPSSPSDKTGTNRASEKCGEDLGWWAAFFNYIYGRSKTSKANSKATMPPVPQPPVPLSVKPKTPFTKLSSFKFRKELGRGAFGRVLLAEAKVDGKLYALKIISKKNMKSSDRKQAKAERDILHAMGHKAPHPFTTGLKFAFQSENNLYLGMDFLPGGNMKELIKKLGYLPENWVRLYAAELVLAISHLHSLNVIYRDIKPHNIMIDGRGHITLIDFGLSKQDILSPRGAMSLVGTPDYSAPEVLKTGVYQIEQSNRLSREQKLERKMGRASIQQQKRNVRGSSDSNEPNPKNMATTTTTTTTCSNNPNPNANGKSSPTNSSQQPADIPSYVGYGKAADWWSVGVMIYEMLCGVPTFRGTDLRQTYHKVLFSDVEFVPPERFSFPARLLISGLLKKDPLQRLGCNGNPPSDIMDCLFFEGIEWDAVYEKRQDGPWIPDPVSFSIRKDKDNSNRSSSSSSSSSNHPNSTPNPTSSSPPPPAAAAAAAAAHYPPHQPLETDQSSPSHVSLPKEDGKDKERNPFLIDSEPGNSSISMMGTSFVEVSGKCSRVEESQRCENDPPKKMSIDEKHSSTPKQKSSHAGKKETRYVDVNEDFDKIPDWSFFDETILTAMNSADNDGITGSSKASPTSKNEASNCSSSSPSSLPSSRSGLLTTWK